MESGPGVLYTCEMFPRFSRPGSGLPGLPFRPEVVDCFGLAQDARVGGLPSISEARKGLAVCVVPIPRCAEIRVVPSALSGMFIKLSHLNAGRPVGQHVLTFVATLSCLQRFV